AGSLRLHPCRCHPDDRGGVEPVARRRARRRELLSRFPPCAARAARAAAVPGRGLPVAGRRRAGRAWAAAPGHRLARDHRRRAAHPGAGILPRALRGRARGDAGRSAARTAGRCQDRRGAGAGAMTVRVFVPRDAAALALGADAVASLLRQAGDVTVVRTGSRGLFWLEPMIEVATDEGRIAYGPVTVADIGGLLDAGMVVGRAA